jgi:hypothetical protein
MKQGCNAFIIKCPPQPLNIGLPVMLVLQNGSQWLCAGNVKPAPGCKPAMGEVPYRLTYVPAEWLKPFGDEQGTDEMLRIAGRPKKRKAAPKVPAKEEA